MAGVLRLPDALSNPDEARLVLEFLPLRLERAGSVNLFLMRVACFLISRGGVVTAGWGMKPEKILVPIDTAKCHPEVFNRVNAFGCHPGVTVILFHVIHLDIAAPDNRVYEELAQEARWHLELGTDRVLQASIEPVHSGAPGRFRGLRLRGDRRGRGPGRG